MTTTASWEKGVLELMVAVACMGRLHSREEE
jgi:hypothetical protein